MRKLSEKYGRIETILPDGDMLTEEDYWCLAAIQAINDLIERVAELTGEVVEEAS